MIEGHERYLLIFWEREENWENFFKKGKNTKES